MLVGVAWFRQNCYSAVTKSRGWLISEANTIYGSFWLRSDPNCDMSVKGNSFLSSRDIEFVLLSWVKNDKRVFAYLPSVNKCVFNTSLVLMMHTCSITISKCNTISVISICYLIISSCCLTNSVMYLQPLGTSVGLKPYHCNKSLQFEFIVS